MVQNAPFLSGIFWQFATISRCGSTKPKNSKNITAVHISTDKALKSAFHIILNLLCIFAIFQP